MIRTVLIGAAGRMGMNILALLPEFPGLQLCGAVVREQHAALGEVRGGIKLTSELPPLLREADLAIDFSSAQAAAANLDACVAARVPLLLGTTGLPPGLQAPLDAAAASIALLVAPNTSPGLNVLLDLVRTAARALPASYDIEILESHHRDKRDAPSGSALALGEAAARGRGVSFDGQATFARQGASARRVAGQIGLASLRGGDVVGEHEVLFLGTGERLVLRHSATDRSVFARGALIAGQWLAGKAAGRYAMSDVFSISGN